MSQLCAPMQDIVLTAPNHSAVARMPHTPADRGPDGVRDQGEKAEQAAADWASAGPAS